MSPEPYQFAVFHVSHTKFATFASNSQIQAKRSVAEVASPKWFVAETSEYLFEAPASQSATRFMPCERLLRIILSRFL